MKILKKLNLVLAFFAITLVGCTSKPCDLQNLAQTGGSSLSIEQIDSDFKANFIDSINKDLIKQIKNFDMNQKVNVIITFSDDSLVSEYNTKHSEFENVSEYAKSRQGSDFVKKLNDKQEKIKKQLLNYKLVDEIKYSYSTILDGIYASTTYAGIEKLSNTAGVERVMISNTYEAPKDAVINHVQVYDTGIFDSSDVEYTGKGTVVAILDTGCDYTHTAFTSHVVQNPYMSRSDIEIVLPNMVSSGYTAGLEARDVYYSSKIPYGYDYADKDADVMPYHSEHGTHVAGIIGGYDSTITGVAVDTQLAIMKVFSDYKDGAEDGDILAALEDSVLLGVDAINMSLGTSCGFTREVDEDYKNAIYDSIEEAGISLIAAASNDYSSAYGSEFGNTNKTSNPDSSTVGAPSTYNAAMSVASINGNKDKYMLANGEQTVFFHEAYNQSAKEYSFFDMLGIKAGNKAIYEYVTVPGVGMTANYMGIDVSGKIALVKRGDISFEEKVQFAAEAGAIACIVYNNVFGDIIMTVGNNVKIPVVSISKDDGIVLASQEGGTIELNADNQAGPFMSDFSSWGPTPSLELKPDITAHGGNILSAVPGGGYEKLSGTSMAAPNMCGITILIRQYVKEKYPNLSNTEVRDLVNQLCMSTATVALDKNGNPYSPRKQGAGLASLYNSVNTDAYLYVFGLNKTKIELGDDPSRTGKYTFEFHLKNLSDKELNYDFSSLFMTESLSTSDPLYVAEMAYMLNPSVDFAVSGAGRRNKNTIVINPNGDCTIKVSMNLSKQDKSYMNQNFDNGIYVEGYICLKTNDGINLNIPVLGFYGDWSMAPIFDTDYYDVESEAYDLSIDDEDKIKADYFATTPYGRYYYDYIIPLGSYVYDIDTTKYDQIPASKEHAAISYYKDSISGLYAVFTGLLRSAKEMNITIKNTATGEIVWSDTQYNCYKAHYSGVQYPYVSSIDLEMSDAILDNNTQYEVTMSAKLDWKTTENNENDRYSFTFYVDYEAPTLTNAEFVKEYDRVDKKDRYYVDLTLYDNHYVQSVRPIILYKNTSTGSLTYTSLVDNPIPVYQSQRGSDTVVRVEITDYLDLIYSSNLTEGLTFFVDDYAMNSNIFQVALPELDNKNLVFTENVLEMKIHDTLDLTDYIQIAGKEDIIKDYLKNLTWTSSNEAVVKVYRGQAEAVGAGSATIRCTSQSSGKNINLVIHVSEEENTDNPNAGENASIEELKFSSYNTLFAFEGDNDFSKVGHTGSINYFDGSPSISFYPTEQIQLNYTLKPWNLAESRYRLEWQSSNERVVQVDENGVVTAVAEGNARITLRITIDGKQSTISARCAIEVKSEFIIENRTLVEYKGKGGEVVIPDDEGILYIGSFAFSHYLMENEKEIEDPDDLDAKKSPIGNTTITSVIIPDGVEEIQKYAFYNCSALKKVELPTTLTKIMEYAFYDNQALEEINLENVIVIGAKAFGNCELLLEANTSKANTIGDFAFENCKFIQAVDLHELKRAGNSAFVNCSRLTTVVLGQWTKLGDNFFENTKISSITIYGNRIPDNVFKDCKRLQTVVVKNDLVYLGEKAFYNCSSLSNIVFEKGVEVIASNAFSGCTALKNFTLPSSDIEIKDTAFAGAGIENLIFDRNTRILHMGVSVFQSCTALKRIYASDSAYYQTEGTGKLFDKEQKTLYFVLPTAVIGSYTLPDSVEIIAEGAFSGSTISSFLCTENSQLKEIQANAFANCTSLTTATLPQSCQIIGEYAFYLCNALKTINLGNVVEIQKYALCRTGIETAVLADNAVIGDAAFWNCKSLTTLTLGANTKIGKSAFQETALISVVMPQTGTVEIGDAAFYLCKSLKNINLACVNKIGSFAFFYCSSLEAVDLSGITYLSEGAFADCRSLKEVYMPNMVELGESAFAAYSSAEGAVFTEITLPESLKVIGVDAFYGCSQLSSIDLTHVETLSKQSFAYCVNLNEVILGEGIKYLPNSVFFGCEKLTSINLEYVEIFDEGCLTNTAITALYIPSAIVLSDYAFTLLSSVNELYAPKVEVVGQFAFNGCSGLTEIVLPRLQSVGTYAFNGTQIDKFLITEHLSKVDYLGFFGTTRLTEFYAEENGERILTKAYSTCLVDHGVLYLTLPNNGYYLAAYPMAKEDKVYSVIENTERIEYYACSNNPFLEEVDLPSSLKTIGNYAFYNLPKLKEVIFHSYFAPTLEGTMTDSNYAPTAEDYKKFDKLYKYDYYYQTAGVVLNPLFYQNFGDAVGKNDNLTYVYPENSEGYDGLLYRVYFNDKLDKEGSRITSGITIGRYAYLFNEACKNIPAVVSWKDKQLLDDIEYYYNLLLKDSTELENASEDAIATFLRALEMRNASLAERQIQCLYDVDASKYSYDRIRAAYKAYSSLTEAEKILVSNSSVLLQKISDLETEFGQSIDFSKEYEAYTLKENSDGKNSTVWIIAICSTVGGLALAGALLTTVLLTVKKKNSKKKDPHEE